MVELWPELIERFCRGKTIPGTHSFYFFWTDKKPDCWLKKLEEDADYYGAFLFKKI